jgi:two-component system sensor histidine kinase HydH
MKISIRTSSCIAAVLCWALFSSLSVFIILGMRDRARLIRDNENEQTLTMLFTSLRGYDDFGSAIEANQTLTERLAGAAVYGNDLTPVYSWGTVPLFFGESILDEQFAQGRNNRYTIPDKRGRTVQFVLRIERTPGPSRARSETRPDGVPREARENPRENPERSRPGMTNRQDSLFFNILTNGKYWYIDISHAAYWRTMSFTGFLFPFSSLVLLVLVFYIRGLYLRNIEYRERIEAQKNLVVLGTAASTLAHEIKNPLLSIRLQTGILRKLFAGTSGAAPGTGREEIAIIEQEVDRLSALSYRVNDYLRDAGGNRVPVNVYDILNETALRLCGRDIIQSDSSRDCTVLMDGDRARSVFENILRNALESGGPAGEIGASIIRNNGSAVITVFDRGRGIAAADLKRVFDPFFTSKSTGTGIGLSISKRFVEALKGTIELENREAGGTLVRITLPEYVAEGRAGG